MARQQYTQGSEKDLKAMLGRRVLRAWTKFDLIAFRLEGNRVIYAYLTPERGRGSFEIRGFEAGPNHKWDGMDQRMPQTRETRDLEGRMFLGVRENLLVFSGRSVKMAPPGPRWEWTN